MSALEQGFEDGSAAGPLTNRTETIRRGSLALGAIGIALLVVVLALETSKASAALDQVWTPFVLVAGLLLVGLVADDDGIFQAAGSQLARRARHGLGRYLGAVAIIAMVTAILNLDTSVAFLTPVFVYGARSRGGGEAPLLYGVLLLSNAGSLLLTGSNLTNLIVLAHVHVSGAAYLASMWGPALAGLAVTAAIVALVERRELVLSEHDASRPARALLGLGAIGVVAVTVLVVVLRGPAVPVVAVGLVLAAVRIAARRLSARRVLAALDVPLLAGLFGVAVALGTLGRLWSGPVELLGHLDVWGVAAFAGIATVLVNNLPAAALLTARAPRLPLALLVGLNLGPNLFVTGSLSWLLWLKAARQAGASPSIARASRIGVLAAPLSIAAAVGVLSLTGAR